MWLLAAELSSLPRGPLQSSPGRSSQHDSWLPLQPAKSETELGGSSTFSGTDSLKPLGHPANSTVLCQSEQVSKSSAHSQREGLGSGIRRGCQKNRITKMLNQHRRKTKEWGEIWAEQRCLISLQRIPRCAHFSPLISLPSARTMNVWIGVCAYVWGYVYVCLCESVCVHL